MSLSVRFGTVGKPISTPKKPGGRTPSPCVRANLQFALAAPSPWKGEGNVRENGWTILACPRGSMGMSEVGFGWACGGDLKTGEHEDRPYCEYGVYFNLSE